VITHGVGAGGVGIMTTSDTKIRRTWQNVNSKRRLQRKIQMDTKGKDNRKKDKVSWHAATLFFFISYYIHSYTHTFNRLIRRTG
jgi:hypothetical protein